MHFAPRLGCVTGLAKDGSEGGGSRGQRATVIPALMFMNRQTAQERVARRGANRKGTKAVVEAQAICSQGIDVRRLNLLVAIGSQVIEAVLIIVNDQYMRTVRRGDGGQNNSPSY
jgi:hypothetical protein